VKKNLLGKSIFAVALVVLVGFFAVPPQEKVMLGLDLKGGMHLLLEVETDSALKSELSVMKQRLGDHLRDREIPLESESVKDDLSLRFVLPSAAAKDLAVSQLSDEGGSFKTDATALEGDRWELKLTFKSDEERRLRESAVRQALETIRNRVDELGVAEPTIQRVGMTGNRILVQLPGVVDPDRAKKIIGRTAMLQLRLMKDEAPTREALLDKNKGKVPDGYEILKMAPPRKAKEATERYGLVEKEVRVSGGDLEDARIGHDEFNAPAVDFRLNRSAGAIFGKFTEKHLNERLAIVLDTVVESAPVIRSRITDKGQITGNFTLEDAEDLSVVLRAGALPASVRYLEERTVGPSLGRDSIRQGTISALIGGALVVLFMVYYYRFAGLIADAALLLDLVLMAGCMALSGAALTLPGIAGIVLTLGMAVDANVIIYERIKEELRAGKTTRAAVEAGFKRALLTIVDSNLTTLIAAVVLFQFGTGPIRGFAITLMIGILASMYTACFMSKLAFEIMIQKFKVKTLSI